MPRKQKKKKKETLSSQEKINTGSISAIISADTKAYFFSMKDTFVVCIADSDSQLLP